MSIAFPYFVVMTAAVAAIWLFARYRVRLEEQSKIAASEKWLSSILADANELHPELTRAAKLQLYHFFEDQWQRHSDAETPSALLNRLFWDCADEKLKAISATALSLWRVNHNPQPADIVRSMLGAAALAEWNSRNCKNDQSLSIRSLESRLRVLHMIDDFCPTLQTGMWRNRFPEAGSTPSLNPFMTV